MTRSNLSEKQADHTHHAFGTTGGGRLQGERTGGGVGGEVKGGGRGMVYGNLRCVSVPQSVVCFPDVTHSP